MVLHRTCELILWDATGARIFSNTTAEKIAPYIEYTAERKSMVLNTPDTPPFGITANTIFNALNIQQYEKKYRRLE
jgi:hypothetical protein